MKKLFVLALILFAGYMVWKKFTGEGPKLKPLYEEPYVLVYGQNSCRWTQTYLERLRSAGVNCIYKEFNNKEVVDEIVPRMREAGLDIGQVFLPVVDINGRILIRPRMKDIFSLYAKSGNKPSGSGVGNASFPGDAPLDDREVFVFGRDSCGWTRKALEQLQQAGIQYAYKTVDEFEVEEELFWRMKDAGLSPIGFSIPVIAAKGKIYVSPNMPELISKFQGG